MNVKIKKLHPSAIVPTYSTSGAACFDLYAIVDDEPLEVRQWFTATFRIGLSFEIPDGFAMLVFSRSGHGFKSDVRLANCVGVIDADYRGEVQVKLTADDGGKLTVRHGDRIAQAMIVPVSQVSFDVVDELSDTERGEGGFGSTGK